ncbi:VOC family protein [Marinomonas transparens]|uniref:VOC family protein n=1 Tax=Marinomonas transparens TaxID=2795388 RepID=A0A934JNZ7_9GAMM|nr:VOC family protein [Marinomonas transparens]MBJ7539296.1 VOC family protein [Marinomonas transparens]
MVKALPDNYFHHSVFEHGFNHLTLSVADLDRSLSFYCDLLGFQGEVRWNSGAYLSYRDCWLCLSLVKVPVVEGKSLGEARLNQDYTHYAFSYDLETIQSVRQKEAFKTVTVWQENTSEGDSLYLNDPDGHKLELHAGSLSTRLVSLKEKPYEGLVWLS